MQSLQWLQNICMVLKILKKILLFWLQPFKVCLIFTNKYNLCKWKIASDILPMSKINCRFQPFYLWVPWACEMVVFQDIFGNLVSDKTYFRCLGFETEMFIFSLLGNKLLLRIRDFLRNTTLKMNGFSSSNMSRYSSLSSSLGMPSKKIAYNETFAYLGGRGPEFFVSCLILNKKLLRRGKWKGFNLITDVKLILCTFLDWHWVLIAKFREHQCLW